MVKANTSCQTKKDIREPSAMENVMARVIGGKIKLTINRLSIVANGNKAFFTVLVVWNGAANLLITRVNSTKVLSMALAHSISEKINCSTTVSFKTT